MNKVYEKLEVDDMTLLGIKVFTCYFADGCPNTKHMIMQASQVQIQEKN